MGVRNELAIPAGAVADDQSVEVLRAWVADEGLHVALVQAFPEPETWGVLLVDVARHAARAFAAEGMCSEADALRRMRAMFEAEWDRPADAAATQS